MGAYLAKPKTSKVSEEGGAVDKTLTAFGASSMQGWRQTMEDAHIAAPSLKNICSPAVLTTLKDLLPCEEANSAGERDSLADISLYAVFDGHASNAVSCWVSDHYVQLFTERLRQVQQEAQRGWPPAGCVEGDCQEEARIFGMRNAVLCEALQQSFLDVDEQMQKEESRRELKKYFEAGLVEQKDNETYIQRYLSDGGDVRLVEMNGQKFLQFVPRTGEDEEDSEGGGGGAFPGVGVEEEGESFAGKEGKEKEEKEEGQEKAVSGRGSAGEAEGTSEEATASTSISGSSASLNGEEDRETDEKKKDKEEKEGLSLEEDNVRQLTRFNSTEVIAKNGPPASPSGGSAEGEPEETVEHMLDGDDNEKTEKAEGDKEQKDDDDEEDRGERPLFAHPSTPEGSGATAVVVLVVGGDEPVVITANAGDSRGVICRGGTAFPLSHDHKPTNPDEKKRIFAAGGYVANGRVDGNLNLSRAVGDLFYKQNKELPAKAQRITAYPDVRITRICEEDEFLILACDGIWDCKTNQEAVDFVRERLQQAGNADSSTLKKICEELCDECLAEDPLQSEGHGCDNMTCLVVELSNRLKRHKAKATENEEKIMLYGGGEDKYLGRDEKLYESDEGEE